MRRTLLAAAPFGSLAAPAQAQAQVTYNGWNLGPDYGAMVEDVNCQRMAQMQAMQQMEAQIVQAAMQDPVCQQHYRNHRAQGGQQPWPNFAFLRRDEPLDPSCIRRSA